MSATVPEHGVDRSVDLLVTLLIRYPELSAVHVSPSGHTLELSFLFSGAVQSRDVEACAAKIRLKPQTRSRFWSGKIQATSGVSRSTINATTPLPG